MGIEEVVASITQSLDRLAKAVETNIELNKRMVEIAQDNNRIYNALNGKAPAAAEPVKAVPADQTYDGLKAQLIRRGVDIPKGTKMTTLQKLWEQHKDDPCVPAPAPTPAPAEEPAPAPAPAEESVFVLAEEPAPAPAEEPERKIRTRQEAQEAIMKDWIGSDIQRNALRAALKSCGIERFSDMQDTQADAFLCAYESAVREGVENA